MRAAVFTISLMLISCFAWTQVKRVLYMPMDKFQFESYVSLENIAAYNQWESAEEVYPNYNRHLLRIMNNYSDSLLFYAVSETDFRTIQSRTPRLYKKEPVTHFGVDLSPLLKSGKLQTIMEGMGADYLMFICRYQINNKVISAIGDFGSNRFINWSNHFLDYEVYDRKGKLICGGERYKMTPHNPKEETYETNGVLIEDLERAFGKLAEQIKLQIEYHQRTKQIVFFELN